MHVAAIYPPQAEKEVLAAAGEAMSDTSVSPTDRAIAEKIGQDRVPAARGRIVRQRSFGNGRKTRAVLRESDDRYMLYVTGAPEEVMRLSAETPPDLKAAIENEARKGHRLVAVAEKPVPPTERDAPFDRLEQGLKLTGTDRHRGPAARRGEGGRGPVATGRRPDGHGDRGPSGDRPGDRFQSGHQSG